MYRKKRRHLEEVNLTPLLDVLFSILFIVMLIGAKGQAAVTEEKEELQKQVEELKEQQAVKEDVHSSWEELESRVKILTLRNRIKGKDHVLELYEGMDDSSPKDSIVMGIDKKEYIRERVSAMIEEELTSAKGVPVFVVFHVDRSKMYTRDEYQPIIEELEALQKSHKEIFYTEDTKTGGKSTITEEKDSN